jgi:hypothetical protein
MAIITKQELNQMIKEEVRKQSSRRRMFEAKDDIPGITGGRSIEGVNDDLHSKLIDWINKNQNKIIQIGQKHNFTIQKFTPDDLSMNDFGETVWHLDIKSIDTNEVLNVDIYISTPNDNFSQSLTRANFEISDDQDNVMEATLGSFMKVFNHFLEFFEDDEEELHSELKGDVKLPDGITRLDFSDNRKLTSIIIPNSVKEIDNYAFAGCTGLKSITIPNSVTKIGDGAFRECSSLKSIIIPNSVTKIGHNAFENCYNLVSVTLPNSLTSIGYNAFDNCESLTSITIPNRVTYIDNWVFYDCESLKSITIPDSIKEIGDGAFAGCTGLKSITIPNRVKVIGNDAFVLCDNLTDIKIPERFKDENTLDNMGFNDKQINLILNKTLKESFDYMRRKHLIR